MSQYKKNLLFLSILSVVCFNQPTQAYAWFFGLDWGDHHDTQAGYTQVAVGGDRYFYHEGVFYTGAPGNYVVVQAPVGAIVYTAPVDFEQVNVDGVVYFRSHDVYYRPEGRGYRVVERPQHHPMGDGQEGHGQQDEHHMN